MWIRFGTVVFLIECFFALSFLITSVPIGQLETPLVNPNPAMLTFIVFGGYCWMALGAAFYLYGAIISLLGKADLFWRSAVPPILGLPIWLWGFGKLEGSTALIVAASFLLIAVAVIGLLAVRTKATQWRVVPIVLPIAFWLTADSALLSGVVNTFIGAALLTIPVYLWIAKSKDNARSGVRSGVRS